MSNVRKLVVYSINENQELTVKDLELDVISGSDSEDWGEDEHLKALYADSGEIEEKKRKKKFELLFSHLEREFERGSDGYHQQIHRINKALIGILVCNGLFITANLIAPPEEKSYQHEFCLSTLLPLFLYTFNEAFLKGTGLEMVPGVFCELVAAGLQKQGAPFWTGPVLTTSLAAIAFTENKVSKWISATCGEVSKTLSSNINNVSNFWHKIPPDPNFIQTKGNEVEEKKAMKLN